MNNLCGQVLSNRYEVHTLIGTGGMAHVYKGRDRLLDRFVAIKVLKDEFKDNNDFLKKFEKESQSAARLSHPNIVGIYDVGMMEDEHFIVMEYVEGSTLKAYLREKNGKLSLRELVEFGLQIAKGLHHAHQKRIIHRDIKPQNIMLSGEGECKIGDFGIARATTSSTVINTKEVVGSVHYSSPEQARGGFIDERSDIYSFGIMMYELATGKLPFTGDTPVSIALSHIKSPMPSPRAVSPELDERMENIIMHATMKNVESRYQSFLEVIEDLNALHMNQPIRPKDVVEVDESPTVIMADVEEIERELDKIESEEDVTKQQTKKKTTKKKKQKVNVLNIVVTIIAAFILVGGVLGIVFLGQIQDIFKGRSVEMPNVVGMSLTQAEKTITDLGLEIDSSQKQYDNDTQKGDVISQSIDPGDELKEGYRVKVVVSNGPNFINVPNVTQKHIDEARVTIQNLGLVVGNIEEQTHDVLSKGMVISQDPGKNMNVKKGDAINLVLSLGPKFSIVLMPDLAGQTIAEATGILSGLNLGMGSISYEENADYPKGQIFIQSVKAGSEIEEGSRVSLSVSTGPPEGTTPEETNPGEETPTDPVTPTEEEGTRQIPYDIPLVFDGDSAVVKLVVVQDGVTTIAYEQEHLKSQGSINVSVTVKNGIPGFINFYFDTKLVTTENFE